MRTAILCVGTELLFGQTVNTNAVYLSRQLQLLGFDVMYHHVVGDNPHRLRRMIEMSLSDCDMIITTGGLGPTEDDLTKEVIAEAMGDVLVEHVPSMEAMKEYFHKVNREMTTNNIKQVYLPSKSEALPNKVGTAPGFVIKNNDKIIMSLPGPPGEMKTMFENYAMPYLEKLTDGSMYYKIIRTFGIGESALETVLLPLIHGQTDPTIATYAKEGECSIRVAGKGSNLAGAKSAVEAMVEKIRSLVGEYIYSEDDEDMAQVLVNELMARGLSVASAESCTGGMFAAELTNYKGVSEVFKRGFVTYSGQSKVEDLGVPHDILKHYNEVSPEMAAAMAVALYEKTGGDFCISITGIAGPDDVGDQYAGLMHIGLCVGGDVDNVGIRTLDVHRKDRYANRRLAVLNMIDMILKNLK